MPSLLLDPNTLLRKRFQIQAIIGKGGYGQIFQAFDEYNNITVAIKAEPKFRKKKRSRRIILEQQILLQLQGKPHVPILIQSGVENNVNFIVMQILSKNVGELRKDCPLQRLSKSTCGRIMQQAIAGLRELHKLGYLHRDIKPANICFGCTNLSRHRLFIIDYGLARRFRYENGEMKPPRQHIGFRGTLRYVSLRMHKKLESGPVDDLISLFYAFIELIYGSLSWQNFRHFSEVKAKKELLIIEDFYSVSEPICESVKLFGQTIFKLMADEEPNYSLLQTMMNDLIGNSKLSDYYDWENNYIEVFKEDKINRSLGYNLMVSTIEDDVKSSYLNFT